MGTTLHLALLEQGIIWGFCLILRHLSILMRQVFDKFPMTPLAKHLSEQPGSGWPFGKDVNGSNLYKHFNDAIEKRGVNHPPISSTKELSNISEKRIPGVSDLAQSFIDRAGQLVGCQVAGVADFKGKDMLFVMDGSVFWKAHNFKKTVEETVRQLTDKKVEFVDIPDCGIVGAIKLVA